MIQANKLNLVPVKGGVSKYYSPRMILNQTNLDYTKHCVVPIGAYRPTTSQRKRARMLQEHWTRFTCARHKTNEEVTNSWTSTAVN
jgi:hypothetical protein